MKIFLTGSSATGKTSFRRSLFKKKFVEEYTSTVLQETKHAYVASILESTDGDVEWLELTADQQINHFRSLLESGHAKEKETKSVDAQSDNVTAVERVSNFETPENLMKELDKSNGLAPTLKIPNPVILITVVDTGGQPEFIDMLPAIISWPTINLVVIDMTKKLADRVEHYNSLKKQGHRHSNKEKKIKMEVQYEVQEEEKISKDDKVEVVCYKVKREQKKEDQVKNDEVKDEVKVKGHYEVKEEGTGEVKLKDNVEVYMHYNTYEDKQLLSYLSYTYEDLIKLLMSITNNVQIQELTQKQDDSQSKTKLLDIIKKPSKYYIGFVGTHKDKTEETIIEQLNNQLTVLVNKEKQQKCHVAPLSADDKKYLYAVDNTISGSSCGEDKEVNKIRKRIKSVTKYTTPFTVPITWMILQIQVKLICDKESKPFITLEDFTDIARREASVETTIDVESVLEYFDLLGIFLYFKEMKNYVIIDQQWFCNTLCKVVGLSPDCPDIDVKKKFEKEGLLSKRELKDKWDKDTEKIEIDPLLSLLVGKKILADYEKDHYYIPHALPRCEHYRDNYKYLLAEPLLVRFSSGFLPTGFFCTLVIHLLQAVPLEWRKINFSQAYSNVITFQVDDNVFLRLQDKRYYLEVQARHRKSNCANRGLFKELVYLRKQLGDVCNTLILDSGKLEYGFLCTGPVEDNHMVVLNSVENPSLKQCTRESCKMVNEMGILHHIWFKEVSYVHHRQ